MKCASFPNLALSTSMALMNVFPMFNLVFACQKQTLAVILFIFTLFHTCFIYFVVFAAVFCIFVFNIIYNVIYIFDSRMLRINICEFLWLLECGAVKQWEMTSLLYAHCLPANRAFQNRKSGWSTRCSFDLAKEARHMQNSHGARLQKQLQTALIGPVTFI